MMLGIEMDQNPRRHSRIVRHEPANNALAHIFVDTEQHRRLELGRADQTLGRVGMRCYSHLSDDEREQIGLLKALGHPTPLAPTAKGWETPAVTPVGPSAT
jgi:hypothetical protein